MNRLQQAAAFAALYNNARSQGMSHLHRVEETMTPEQARNADRLALARAIAEVAR